MSTDPEHVPVVCRYRGENINGDFERYTEDSRSILLGADGTVSLGKYFSFNVLLDYEYRGYAPFAGRGRVTENLTASGSLTVSR